MEKKGGTNPFAVSDIKADINSPNLTNSSLYNSHTRKKYLDLENTDIQQFEEKERKKNEFNNILVQQIQENKQRKEELKKCQLKLEIEEERRIERERKELAQQVEKERLREKMSKL